MSPVISSLPRWAASQPTPSAPAAATTPPAPHDATSTTVAASKNLTCARNQPAEPTDERHAEKDEQQ